MMLVKRLCDDVLFYIIEFFESPPELGNYMILCKYLHNLITLNSKNYICNIPFECSVYGKMIHDSWEDIKIIDFEKNQYKIDDKIQQMSNYVQILYIKYYFNWICHYKNHKNTYYRRKYIIKNDILYILDKINTKYIKNIYNVRWDIDSVEINETYMYKNTTIYINM